MTETTLKAITTKSTTSLIIAAKQHGRTTAMVFKNPGEGMIDGTRNGVQHNVDDTSNEIYPNGM